MRTELSMLSTREATQKDKNNDPPRINKESFCVKPNMIRYLKENCPIFDEQFELLNFLKKGSTGYVYEGRSKNSNSSQKYAFKFCIETRKKEGEEKEEEKGKEKNAKKEKEKENKYKEISLNKKLHHKNIIQILAFIKMKEGSFFSVLENGKHRDLDFFVTHLLKRRILSETCILYFAKQILDGIYYLFRRKIIHMDIKQGNIIIDSELNPKLIDFSASCSFSEFQYNDLVKFPCVGTRRYISPEIEKKTHMLIKDGEKIDIYSFGVTLYNLAFGVYPYSNSKKDGGVDEQEEKLEFPSGVKISNMFKDFLTKTLQRDYKKRIGIKEAMNHPWIQGWKILEEEKINISCLENFLIRMVTDSIPKFNDYIKKNS